MTEFTFYGDRVTSVELKVKADTFDEAVIVMDNTPDAGWTTVQTEQVMQISVQNETTEKIADYINPLWSEFA